MSRRVLLGKAGSDYGLFISKLGVDVLNDAGTLCHEDLMIFDSRQKGYAQLVDKGSITIPKNTDSSNNAVTKVFSSISIPNAVVILYTAGKHVELTSVSTTAFIVQVPNKYPSIVALGYTGMQGQNNPTLSLTTAQTVIKYIVLRGYA